MKQLRSVLVISLMLVGSSAGAGIRYPAGIDSVMIALEQEITPADLKTLRDNPYLKAGKSVVLHLDSPGGDLLVAIEIGRLLRETRSSALVQSGKSCMSSCVLVLAGAVNRFVDPQSTIGIHRPFSTSNAELTQAQATKRYRDLEALSRTYLKDVNVPDALFDAMVMIPAEEMRVLSDDEIFKYGLATKDPVEAEMQDATEASKFGLNRLEYLARKRESRRLCQFPADAEFFSTNGPELTKAYYDCVDRVLRQGR
jgi:ATP-dependent protease ClpP protease subunit